MLSSAGKCWGQFEKAKKTLDCRYGNRTDKNSQGFAAASGRVHIEALQIEKTPENVWMAGQPQKKQELAAFLRPLLKGFRRNDELMLLINHKEMIVSTFTFPMMTLGEVEEAIYWKMQLLVAGNIDNWRIDFTARERTQRLEYLGIDDKKMDVIGVGVEKVLLSWYIRGFKKSGCLIKSIVPQFYTFSCLIDQNEEQSTLIIEMGKASTRLFYYSRGSLIENHRIELDSHWTGETYLKQIIKAAEEMLLSPLAKTKGDETSEIYLMGGESLHEGVMDYLSKWLKKGIRPTYFVLDERDELIFPRQLTKSELCLITPVVCGLIKWAQADGVGGRV